MSKGVYIENIKSSGVQGYINGKKSSGGTVNLSRIEVMTPTITIAKTPLYGLLYNGYAVKDARGLAPVGWHLMDIYEMTNIINFVEYLYPEDVVYSFKEIGSEHWNDNSNATNASGFTALGAGVRDDGTMDFVYAFNGKLDETAYWTSDESGNGLLMMWSIDRRLLYGYTSKIHGKSIRCVRDTLDGWTENEIITDIDGNNYETVKIEYDDGKNIGTYIILKQNLAVTHYRNGDVIPEVTNTDAWIALTTGALCAYDNDWTNVFI